MGERGEKRTEVRDLGVPHSIPRDCYRAKRERANGNDKDNAEERDYLRTSSVCPFVRCVVVVIIAEKPAIHVLPRV